MKKLNLNGSYEKQKKRVWMYVCEFERGSYQAIAVSGQVDEQ